MISAHLLLSAALTMPSAAATHPLDPLSREELSQAAALIKADKRFPAGSYFAQLSLREPPKAEVLRFKAGETFRREALAVLLDPDGQTHEALVDLGKAALTSWTPKPGAQPAVLSKEFTSVPEIVRADPRWQEAMRRRGLTKFEDILIDPWAAGAPDRPQWRGRRLLRALSYLKGTSSNIYGRPIEGVMAVVDIGSRKVVDFVDGPIIPISPDDGAFDAKAVGAMRSDIKPLRIVQPEGRGFSLRGWEVLWQKWRFRFALDPREGPVLYQVAYRDKGDWRPVLYRAALSEMVVPYADPEAGWAWRSAFDVGEYGIGRLTSPFDIGRDAPENAVFINADFADDTGTPYEAPRALALYERDGGVLWKHFDSYTQKNDSRRGRELVLGFFAAVANYDYGLRWVFKQDGSIEVESDLTGIMLAKGVSSVGHHDTGHLVAQGVVAPHHQHFFNFRLDLDVDGAENLVSVMREVRSPPARNPFGNAFETKEATVAGEGGMDLDPASQQRWAVRSVGHKNSLGAPTAFALIPGANSVPFAEPGSVVRRRAGFLDHALWVTRYRDGELHAAGDYPNQSEKGSGLELFANSEPLGPADVVLWYTVGVTHVPRPEEWPVMPSAHAGFKLLPVGFFARNPALDVP